MEEFQKNIKQGSQSVVDIFEKNYDALILYGLSLGAKKAKVEDSIQDLFLKFCENESLILEAEYKLAYIKTSLRRQILLKIKNQPTRIGGSKILEISVPSYEEELIKQQSSLQDALAVKVALSNLSKSQKTIMTMRFYRSMSYEEIAEKLGVTKRTVYNQVHDAMKKMRGSLVG